MQHADSPRFILQRALRPSEDFGLYARRHILDLGLNRELGGPNTKDKVSARPGLAHITGLQWYGDNIDGLPGTDELLAGHTRYPLFAQFLSEEEKALLRSHHVGAPAPGIAGTLGLTHSPRSRMAVCHSCVRTDLKSQGYATWKREHLVPAASMCATHKEPLMTFCDVCEAGHRRKRTNWIITTECICEVRSMKPILETNDLGMEFGIEMAKMTRDIMTGKAPTSLSAESMTLVLGHTFGFRRHTVHGAGQQLLEAMNDKCGSELVRSLGIGMYTAHRLVGSITTYGHVRNAIHHLTALYTVNDGVVGFEKKLALANKSETHRFAAEQERIASGNNRHQDRYLKGQDYIDAFYSKPKSEQRRITRYCREWLKGHLTAKPSISRTELWRKNGKRYAVRHLRLIDTAFFDKNFPKKAQTSRKLEPDTFYARLAKYLARKHSLAIKTMPTERITKTYLLSNFPCESAPSKLLASDAAQALIAMYAETTANFRKRLSASNQEKRKRDILEEVDA